MFSVFINSRIFSRLLLSFPFFFICFFLCITCLFGFLFSLGHFTPRLFFWEELWCCHRNSGSLIYFWRVYLNCNFSSGLYWSLCLHLNLCFCFGLCLCLGLDQCLLLIGLGQNLSLRINNFTSLSLLLSLNLGFSFCLGLSLSLCINSRINSCRHYIISWSSSKDWLNSHRSNCSFSSRCFFNCLFGDRCRCFDDLLFNLLLSLELCLGLQLS